MFYCLHFCEKSVLLFVEFADFSLMISFLCQVFNFDFQAHLKWEIFSLSPDAILVLAYLAISPLWILRVPTSKRCLNIGLWILYFQFWKTCSFLTIQGLADRNNLAPAHIFNIESECRLWHAWDTFVLILL